MPGFVPAALAVVALCAASAGPAAAQAYKVTLKNGNTFLAKYEPEDATYDSSKLLLTTEVGNRIALAKDDVADIVADVENRGFGRIIDHTTILVGVSANDAPGGEEGEEGAAGDGTLMQVPTPNPYLPSVFSGGFPAAGFPAGAFGSSGGTEIAEPGAFSAGIPLSFVSGVAPVPPN
jgi:hypothetical protein